MHTQALQVQAIKSLLYLVNHMGKSAQSQKVEDCFCSKVRLSLTSARKQQ